MTTPQAEADRQHAINAWLNRSDGGRWGGDEGLPLAVGDIDRWPAAAATAYLALLGATLPGDAPLAEVRAHARRRVVLESAARYQAAGVAGPSAGDSFASLYCEAREANLLLAVPALGDYPLLAAERQAIIDTGGGTFTLKQVATQVIARATAAAAVSLIASTAIRRIQAAASKPAVNALFPIAWP